jgi:signal transduction histidine kinase
LAHKKRNFFTPHHAELALTIANQAAITLVNEELYENAQAYAAVKERKRIAQNLHDAINQSLFSASLIAEVLPRLWEREPEEARRSLENLRRLARGAMAEMRALLVELQPTTLIDSEIGDLLLLLGNAFSGRTNIPVDLTITGESSLSSETQVSLYHICQEALNNVAKHSNATQVEITLDLAPERFELNIHDNGCGFDLAKPTLPDHYGLQMMFENAKSIGAEMTIKSQLKEGTQINIRWAKTEGK